MKLEIVKEGTYIVFLDAGFSASGKTLVFEVATKELHKVIGIIKFDAGWWKYTFFPYSETKYEWVCMREISDFCENQTKQWRQAVVRKESK